LVGCTRPTGIGSETGAGEPKIGFPTPQDDPGMRLFLLSMGTLFLALTIRPSPEAAPVAPRVANAPDVEEPWYSPAPEHFRPSYDQDAANRAKQTWSQYWGWVKVFYEGNMLSQGWTERSKGLLADLKSASDQKRLRAMLNAAGKEIALEWAKDYNIRKVSSADLLTWGKTLEKAKARDDGSGGEFHRVIDGIRHEYRRKRGLTSAPREGKPARDPRGRVTRPGSDDRVSLDDGIRE
jgi:hypothetical protein